VNAVIGGPRRPGAMALYVCYNAEYLFPTPSAKTPHNRVGEMAWAFHTKSAANANVGPMFVDLTQMNLEAAPNAVSLGQCRLWIVRLLRGWQTSRRRLDNPPPKEAAVGFLWRIYRWPL